MTTTISAASEEKALEGNLLKKLAIVFGAPIVAFLLGYIPYTLPEAVTTYLRSITVSWPDSHNCPVID